MFDILTIFEQRLGKLEQTILPVYQETEQLQKRQQSKFYTPTSSMPIISTSNRLHF